MRAKNINRKPSRRNSLARDLQNSVSSTDMKKGKQGGFRVVYFVFLSNELIVLLDIYSKTVRETSDCRSKELFRRISFAWNECTRTYGEIHCSKKKCSGVVEFLSS